MSDKVYVLTEITDGEVMVSVNAPTFVIDWDKIRIDDKYVTEKLTELGNTEILPDEVVMRILNRINREANA